MKKLICILLCICTIVMAGCSDKKKGSEQESSPDDANTVDLTKLSSTMVYAEVYGMTTEPDKYKGKNVVMAGTFSVYHDDTTGKDYFACIIADATACCSQGIEFTLSGDHKYPDDYPAVGSNITVSGTFGTYQEGDYTYCELNQATLIG